MRAAASIADAEHRPFDWGRLLQIAGLVCAAFMCAGQVMTLLVIVHAMPGVGDIGRERKIGGLKSPSPGTVFMNTVLPGSPLDQAGVKEGDQVTFDRPFDVSRYPHAGERIGLTVNRSGQKIHLNVEATPVFGAPFANRAVPEEIASIVSLIMPAFLGLFVIARSRRNIATVLFGLTLLAFGTSSSLVSLLPLGFFAPAYMLYVAGSYLLYLAPVAFAMIWGRPAGHRLSKIDVVVLISGAILISTASISGGFYFLTARAGLYTIAMGARTALTALAIAVAFGIYLALGRAASPPKERARYNLLLAALGIMMLTTVFWYLPREIDQFLHLDDDAVLYIYVLMVGIVSPALLTYVILRHRVFDLGFVINRTLVYGVVSAILLGAFGLIEWAADHFVPIAGRGKNVLFDAVLAVVVYLTFNRLEHFVKQTVESLFFRSWQHQEKALRRFVREAAFFTKSKTLLDASIAALNTFAEGAGVAVYMTDENRTFARIAGRLGSAPDMLDPDDPTLVRLRAERQPVELSATQSHLQAAIAVPMVTRNDVVGIVLLGAKPSGLDFRPDEIELIGWATHQIGLDLQTLKVEQLEVERAELKRSAAELERILRTLRVQSTRRPLNPS